MALITAYNIEQIKGKIPQNTGKTSDKIGVS